jgi:uncharacterized protein (TIGR02996 family)
VPQWGIEWATTPREFDMDQETAFLKAIAANPEDDTVRLAFADWLDEQNDPRGPWVRDKDVWEWMKPDAKDPTEKLLAAAKKRQWQASHVLGRMGPAVIPALLTALRGAKDRAASGVRSALEKLGPAAEPALPLLLASLRDDDPRVRHGAFLCLAGMTKTNAVAFEHVVAAVDDPDEIISGHAVYSLHDVGPAAAVAIPALIREVRARRRETTWNAAGALGSIGPAAAEAIPCLVELLSDDRNGNAAASALGQIGLASAEPILDAVPHLTGHGAARAANALAWIRGAVIPALREAVNSPCPATRRVAAEALAQVSKQPADGSLPVLLESIRSDDPVARSRALGAIRLLGPAAADAVPTLAELITAAGTDQHLRESLAYTLADLRAVAAPAVPALTAWITNGLPHPGQAAYALERLGRGPSAVLTLLEASTREPDAREGVRSMTPGRGDRVPGYGAVLRAYDEQDAETATLVELATAAITRPAGAVPLAKAAFGSKSTGVRVAAVFALEHLGTPEAARELIPALADRIKLVRAQAVLSLGRIGGAVEGIEETIRTALGDRAKEVRLAAEEAVKRLTPGSA